MILKYLLYCDILLGVEAKIMSKANIVPALMRLIN